MARKFTKVPRNYVKATDSLNDHSGVIAWAIEKSLFEGGKHNIEFVTWTGLGNSFIVTDGDYEYRVTVTKEL